MEFWNKLSTALKQKDFSAAQIKKLQEAFGNLDVAELLGLSFTVRLIKTDATKKPPFEHLGASADLLNEIDKPSDLLFRGRRDSRGRPPLLAKP